MDKTLGASVGQSRYHFWDQPETRGRQKESLDLNLVLEASLHKIRDPETLRPFIRCDELPVVNANGEKLSRCLDHLLRFIFASSPAGTPLFLYIKCDSRMNDFIDLTVKNGERLYSISFQTNSLAEGDAFPIDQKNYCNSCLTEMKGKLLVNTEPGTGWLFTLEVPGKLK
jgi:hypothetical protein